MGRLLSCVDLQKRAAEQIFELARIRKRIRRHHRLADGGKWAVVQQRLGIRCLPAADLLRQHVRDQRLEQSHRGLTVTGMLHGEHSRVQFVMGRVLLLRRAWRRELSVASIVFGIGLAIAQTTGPTRPVPFRVFLQSVRNAEPQSFLQRAGSRIEDAAAFEKMRQYILSLYRGVTVKRSYVLDSQTFDCIPLGEQPSLRGAPQKLLARGNAGCEDKTIPMARVTLEQLSHFATLEDFLHKAPGYDPDAPHR